MICWPTLLWALHDVFDIQLLSLNMTPIVMLGSALAIFVAFRNSSAYARWWEACAVWASLTSYSREFARMIINFVDVQIRAHPERKDEMHTFQQQMIYRQIAFVYAFKAQLRNEDLGSLSDYLTQEDLDKIKGSDNQSLMINLINGDQLRKGQDLGMLEWFHTFQIEGNLTQFANHLAACEKLKQTPLPRQYEYFTRLFVNVFAFLLPFGLYTVFMNTPAQQWLMIPLSILISGTFVIMERVGAALEDPFENKNTDIPLSAICNTIERDLKAMLGEDDLPPKIIPELGYLN